MKETDPKLHADDVDIDPELVRQMLFEQFPQYARLPIRKIVSPGTVNAVYRLGNDLCIRMPRGPKWIDALKRELTWLPVLAPRLPLAIPQPVAEGRPTAAYPFPWAIYRWIEGQAYEEDLVDDECEAAGTLAGFVAEMRQVDVTGAPRGGRQPLDELDVQTRETIEAARDLIDAGAVTAAWENARRAPAWDGNPVWIHADLLRPNLLVRDGRLSAVIDFGSMGVGDPAADVIPAWSVFGPAGRESYRRLLQVDDGTWQRGRAYALHQAILIVPYYAGSKPEFAGLAQRTIREIIGS